MIFRSQVENHVSDYMLLRACSIFFSTYCVLLSFIGNLQYIHCSLSKRKSYDAMTNLSIDRFSDHTCS